MMSEGSVTADAQRVLARFDTMQARAGLRHVLGIAGPPGSGKSTLAAEVVAALNARRPGCAALVPMDGYHLENADLDRLGLRAVKGAPQTFDAAGLLALVARAREAGRAIRYPVFDRAQDRALPDAGAIDAGVEVVVVEGNYLLLPMDVWAGLRALFDLSVMLRPSLATLEARLVARWTGLGLPEQEIRARVFGNDLPNAQLVLEHSLGADLYLPEE
jgi:pantothenate kinase